VSFRTSENQTTSPPLVFNIGETVRIGLKTEAVIIGHAERMPNEELIFRVKMTEPANGFEFNTGVSTLRKL
jgi:hypothetical protein